MRFFFILTTVIGGALAILDPFVQFAEDHNKQYNTRAELVQRRAIFENNHQDMLEHNVKFESGEVSWSRQVTPYYDLTIEEFTSIRTGLPKYDNTTFEDKIDQAYLDRLNEVSGKSPSEWSWVSQGAMSSVKNQGTCGSCAAFATIAILETCFWSQRGVMYDDLSEQHLVDCANGHYYQDSEGWWGAFGCVGAWPPAYMDFLMTQSNGYTQAEAAYPYTASDGTCRAQQSGYFTQAQVTGQYNKWYTNEAEMKDLVYINPVTTSLQATYLGDYHTGIYDDSRCCEQATDSNCRNNLNHEVTVVGYGSQGGKDYWLCKNSWGSSFGENGYFKIKRGTGHCGVGSLHFTSAYCKAL